MMKIVLLLVKYVFIGLNEGISEKVCQVAQKHTGTLSRHSQRKYEIIKND